MSTLEVSNLNDGTTTVATTYITNGSAKVWCNWDGTGTPSIRDSLNSASLTDNGTANIQVNFTNNMANGNYSCTAAGKYTGAGTGVGFGFRNVTTPLAAGSVQTFAPPDFSQSAVDNPYSCIAVHGDLA
jgi:hypothetical protein